MEKREGQKNFGARKRVLLSRKLGKKLESVFLQHWIDGLALGLA